MLLAKGLRAARKADGSVRITLGEGPTRKRITLCTGDQERLLRILRADLGEQSTPSTPAERSRAHA